MNALKANSPYLFPAYFSIAFSLSTMVSCSSGEDDSTTTPIPENFDSLWLRDCQANDSEATSHKDIVFIDGTTSERIRETYTDSDCQFLTAITSYEATIEYGLPGTDTDSGLTVYPVDLTVGEFRITPVTQEATDAYNERRLCGVATYTANQATTVSTDCDIFDFGTSVLYGLWAADEDLLYFGSNPTDSLTIANRPTTLDFVLPFRRANR